MKKDASRFSPKGVLFHRTFFTAPVLRFSIIDAKHYLLQFVFTYGFYYTNFINISIFCIKIYRLRQYRRDPDRRNIRRH